MSLAILLMACTGGPECDEETACPFGSVCVEGSCEVQYCSTSDGCGMEQYCANGRCTEGCAAPDDCYPGDQCDAATATCITAACDEHSDCAFREFCNEVTGECFESGAYYCGECYESGYVEGQCGSGETLCYGGYCVPSCQTQSDCPAGFECIEFYDASSGQTSYQGCLTDCDLYGDYLDELKPGQPKRLPILEEAYPTCLEVAL